LWYDDDNTITKEIFMNVKIKRAALAATILALLLSLCVSVCAAAYPVAYNGGERHVLCGNLSDLAESYYQGDQTYQVLSEQSGSELLNSLRTLMTKTHTTKTSYNNSRDMAYMTDSQSGDGKIVLLYTSVLVTQSDFIGSGSIGWNREHVWPKSLGGFKNEGAGADLHHVRPSDVTTNAKRANLKYGNVENGMDAKGSSLVGGASGGSYNATYFEPLDNVKGDVARICLYVYARYGGEISQCSSITNVFQSVDVLLEWCALDPVDEWEMGRNDMVWAIQGNRNVFIDYPEYAWLIFDREIPADMATPSGMAGQSTQTPDRPSDPGEGGADNTPQGGHTHTFSDWLDNGDGTSSRICLDCAHMETQGEVTPPTSSAPQGCAATGGTGAIFVVMTAAAFLLTKRRKF
jgi:endonuclease I